LRSPSRGERGSFSEVHSGPFVKKSFRIGLKKGGETNIGSLAGGGGKHNITLHADSGY